MVLLAAASRRPVRDAHPVATTYLHPKADDLESLQQLAKREDGEEMHAFKAAPPGRQRPGPGPGR